MFDISIIIYLTQNVEDFDTCMYILIIESSTKCLFKDIKHIGPKYFQGVKNISRALTDYSLIFNS